MPENIHCDQARHSESDRTSCCGQGFRGDLAARHHRRRQSQSRGRQLSLFDQGRAHPRDAQSPPQAAERRASRLARSVSKKKPAAEPVAVEKILEALFRPVSRSHRPAAPRAAAISFASSRSALAEPGAYLKPLVEKEFAEKTRRFHRALRRSLPAAFGRRSLLAAPFRAWRFPPRRRALASARLHLRGRCRITNSDAVLRRIINFCAAGLRSPA